MQMFINSTDTSRHPQINQKLNKQQVFSNGRLPSTLTCKKDQSGKLRRLISVNISRFQQFIKNLSNYTLIQQNTLLLPGSLPLQTDLLFQKVTEMKNLGGEGVFIPVPRDPIKSRTWAEVTANSCRQACISLDTAPAA